jgi:hypothetical protein
LLAERESDLEELSEKLLSQEGEVKRAVEGRREAEQRANERASALSKRIEQETGLELTTEGLQQEVC